MRRAFWTHRLAERLIGTDKRCGLAAMRALYELAFAGRSEMRAIVLHAVGGVKNFRVMQFYTRAGLMHPQALGKTNKDFAELAACSESAT